MRHAHVRAVLPRLRRHAYILAGDRDQADQSVVECLKAYKKEPHRVRPDAASLDMFRLFHDVNQLPAAVAAPVPPAMAETVSATAEGSAPYASASSARSTSHAAQKASPPGNGGSDVLRRFQALPPGHRQVLTLVTVERFSATECAHVLGLPKDRVLRLLGEARQGMAGVTS